MNSTRIRKIEDIISLVEKKISNKKKREAYTNALQRLKNAKHDKERSVALDILKELGGQVGSEVIANLPFILEGI